ncbi:MAG: hypothetical protein EU536_01365 [Promethearchaeota archaeon]|nr:MAG: hypothetical protein EU536_01365 [Candidatus Lokiarchaeota archaeon]
MSLGFCDLQVNGFKGVDFSSPTLTPDEILFVSRELFKLGVLGYCPAVISSPLEVYRRNLPILAKASKSKEGAQILGIHLEGPFINAMNGPRGIHPEEYIQLPSFELFDKFVTWAENQIALLTIAPELLGSLELIEHIVSTTDIVVSLGHLNADPTIIKDAIDTGARAATHIGNGLMDLIPRHNNPLWPILADDRIYGLFITDGSHLPSAMVKVCLRAKGASKFIVTSDMVHLGGASPGQYDFHGIPVEIKSDGSIRRKGSTQHAGASIPMISCMNYLASLGELDVKGLAQVGYENPLALLNQTIDDDRLNKAPPLIWKSNQFYLEIENTF